MPDIRLAILVTDGTRFVVDLREGKDLPGIDIATGETREDEAILDEEGAATTGLPIGGYRFLESVLVRRGTGLIVNLYHATTVAGDAFPPLPPELLWVTAEDLKRSAMPTEVLDTLGLILGSGDVERDSAAGLRSAWERFEVGG